MTPSTMLEDDHAPSGDFALGNGVITDAFDIGFITRSARRQALIAAVLPQAAPVHTD